MESGYDDDLGETRAFAWDALGAAQRIKRRHVMNALRRMLPIGKNVIIVPSTATLELVAAAAKIAGTGYVMREGRVLY
jgi:hypothetical protein